jgi:hypothetical protein
MKEIDIWIDDKLDLNDFLANMEGSEIYNNCVLNGDKKWSESKQHDRLKTVLMDKA